MGNVEKSTSGVLATVPCLRSPGGAPRATLAAALLDSLFEHSLFHLMFH
jgi:hypothetical protein